MRYSALVSSPIGYRTPECGTLKARYAIDISGGMAHYNSIPFVGNVAGGNPVAAPAIVTVHFFFFFFFAFYLLNECNKRSR